VPDGGPARFGPCRRIEAMNSATSNPDQGRRHAPQGDRLAGLSAGRLLVLGGGHGLAQGRAHYRVPGHIQHTAGRHEQEPVDGKAGIDEMVHPEVLAEAEGPVGVLGDVVIRMRPGLRGEAEPGGAASHLLLVVPTDEVVLGAEPHPRHPGAGGVGARMSPSSTPGPRRRCPRAHRGRGGRPPRGPSSGRPRGRSPRRAGGSAAGARCDGAAPRRGRAGRPGRARRHRGAEVMSCLPSSRSCDRDGHNRGRRRRGRVWPRAGLGPSGRPEG
jgi:hypothetical protein